MEYSPILITVYNRVNHFINCIESLKKCHLAKQSHLFIAIDAPYQNTDLEANNQIIKYSKTISGFKEITIFIRNQNLGARGNIDLSRSDIFRKYDTLIFSEDDNVFSIDFLLYINKGFDTYKDREDVFSISGYQYPISMPKNYDQDVYLWQGYSAWGVGIWREKWEKVLWEKDDAINIIKRFLKSYKSIYKHHKVANHYIPAKLKMIEQNWIHGDGYISLYQFQNNMYSVFPVVSRVRNMGHDGSGFGCGHMENDIYAQQEVYSGEVGQFIMTADLQPQNEINKVLSKHFKRPLRSKIKTMGKIVLLNAGLWP
jgi:hypothetical protein